MLTHCLISKDLQSNQALLGTQDTELNKEIPRMLVNDEHGVGGLKVSKPGEIPQGVCRFS